MPVRAAVARAENSRFFRDLAAGERRCRAALRRPVHDRPVKRGCLLVFEGLDGSGKSTQVELLAAALRAAGHAVLETFEPTDGPIGVRIRTMARSGEALAPEEELRWFVEDRRVHVRETLEPALAAGRHVVCDRYFLSTVAYQGARGLDWHRILAQSEAEFPLPDLVLLLDLEPTAGLARVRDRGAAIEGVFERADFLERVAAIFRAIDRPYIERVQASGCAADVHLAVVDRVRTRLGLL